MKIILKNSDLVFRSIPAREFNVSIPSREKKTVDISLKQGVTYVIDFSTAPVDQNINIFPTGSETELIGAVAIGETTARFIANADYESIDIWNWSQYDIKKILVKP